MLFGEEVAVEASAVLFTVSAGGFQFFSRARGDEGVAVDLAVWMVQRHPYRLALVLEDEDVSDLFAGPELGVAVRPHPDEVADSPLRQPGQGLLVLVGVDDDLGHATPRGGRLEGGAGLVGHGSVRDVRGKLVF